MENSYFLHDFVLQLKMSTVEFRYNAVLGVHGSDPQCIRFEGYNAVFPPTPPLLRMVCICSQSSPIMNIFTVYATIFCEYAGKDENNQYILCCNTSIKSYLVFSCHETYYQTRQAVILFVNDTAGYYYIID